MALFVATVVLAGLLAGIGAPTDALIPWRSQSRVVDIEFDPSSSGFWVVDQYGRVYPSSGAAHHGAVTDPNTLGRDEEVVSISSTPDGFGYWLFTDAGRVLPFGTATHHGDLLFTPLNQPILDSASTPSGNGYYMVGGDGGVFAFGDAVYAGSTADIPLNQPVNGLSPVAGGGYHLVAGDGGVFALGGADFRGSTGNLPLNAPIVGAVPFGNGYLLVGADGGIFNFSDKPFYGSLGNRAIPAPAVAVAANTSGDRYAIALANGVVWGFDGASSAEGDLGGELLDIIQLEPWPRRPIPITPVHGVSGTHDFRGYGTWAAAGATDVRIPSTVDGHLQPAFWVPPSHPGQPLLVVLHSWSSTYTQRQGIPYAVWARDNGWAMIAPNFRGINDDPRATGSDLAVADVIDAVDYATARGADPDRVFVVGYSGGGMMTLLMAGRHPDRFAGAAAWVGIHNLPEWYDYNVRRAPYRNYLPRLQASCGGAPVSGSRAGNECLRRSPITYLDAARQHGTPVYIATGLQDTLVPPSESVNAFNQLAAPADRFTPAQTAALGARILPPELAGQTAARSFFGPEDPRVVLTRRSGSVTLVVFQATHTMLYEPGLRWFAEGAPSGG